MLCSVLKTHFKTSCSLFAFHAHKHIPAHTLTFSINLSIFLTELRLCPPDWPGPSSDVFPVCLSSNLSASFSLPSAIRQSVWYWLYVFRAFIRTCQITYELHISIVCVSVYYIILHYYMQVNIKCLPSAVQWWLLAIHPASGFQLLCSAMWKARLSAKNIFASFY